MIVTWMIDMQGIARFTSRMEPQMQIESSGFGIQNASTFLSQFIQYCRTTFIKGVPLEGNQEIPLRIGQTIFGQQVHLTGTFHALRIHSFRHRYMMEKPFLPDNRLCRKKLLLTKESRPGSPSLRTVILRSFLSKIRSTNAPLGIFFLAGSDGSCRVSKRRL